MTIYDALAARCAPVAALTDRSPVLARIIRTVAIGAARWSEKTRQDAALAALTIGADDRTLVVRLRARESVVPTYTSVVGGTFHLAARFIKHNDAVPTALPTIVNWALRQIRDGATSFSTSWSPDGFIAISARVPKAA